MARSKVWSRSPGKLWLPAPTRRALISGAAAGGAALLLGCDGKSKMGISSIDGTGGAAETGTGGTVGTGGKTGTTTGATGGTGGSVPADAGAQATMDALSSGPADALLQSDGLLVVPDGSVISVDSGGAPAALPALACTKRSEQIVGPYPAASVQLDRSDIRSDPGDGDMVKKGVPLQIVIRVGSKGLMGCSPLKGAVVNSWQCDAAGVYASYASEGTGKNKYLRGFQTADGDGVVSFKTIYPGSYEGRCVHTHFSVRMSAAQSFPSGGFVGQLYFPDDVTTEVLKQPGYNASGRVTNARDGFYKSDMLATIKREGDGYIALFELAI